jgi:hypothetical protein
VNQIIPSSLLFDYRVRVPACPKPSRKKTGRLLKLADSAQLPNVSTMDSGASFSTVHVGWNSNGLGIRMVVRGRTQPLVGEPNQPADSDCVELWVDTRPTGNVHRATGYCHRLACFPCDQSANGEPTVVPIPIPQQREVKSDMQSRHIQLRVHSRRDGYDMEVWIPESQLYGYREIDELRQLGFYCLVRDTELGEQPLTVTEEFPFAWDPSLWVHLELTDK